MKGEPVVYIVDDDEGVRNSLKMFTESVGLRVEAFASAEAFLASITGTECGCVVLDFRLPGINGVKTLDLLRSQNPALVVLVVTGHAEIEAAVQSMKLGAIDFLEKPLDLDLLLAKIEEGLARSEAAILSRAQESVGKMRLNNLTARENEILTLLINGKSSKQIAIEMQISLRTVSNHRAHLLAKTGAENTADLVRMAVSAKAVQS